MAATNKRLLISESRGDSNRCTPYRGNPTNTTRTLPTSVHVRPTYSSYGWSPYVATFHTDPTELDRFTAPNSTSQPGWVVRGTCLNFSPNTAIEAVRLTQTSVDNRLLGLPSPYHRHTIGTFNTCSWVPTPRSLTNTGGGYHIENLRIATALSPSFPFEGSTDPPNGPARSQIIHNNYQLNWRGKQTINLMSGSIHLTSIVTYHLRIAWANNVPPR
jgi:hypothetical protein